MSLTLVIKFSRKWCLIPFFDNFSKLKFPQERCSLLAINNSKFDLITGYMSSIASQLNEHFNDIHIVQTDADTIDRYHPLNFKDVPLPFHTHTARRSFELQKLINSLVKTDLLIVFEDDTLSHPDLILKLLNLMEDDHVVCATSPTPHKQKGFKIVGHNAYNIMEFDKDGFLTRRSNHPIFKEGIKDCEATGYCGVAFRKDLYEKAIKFIENLKFRIIGSGSDIYFTNSMLERGKLILCDFSIWNEHIDIADGKVVANTVENCKPWDWVWRPRRGCYNLKFIEET